MPLSLSSIIMHIYWALTMCQALLGALWVTSLNLPPRSYAVGIIIPWHWCSGIAYPMASPFSYIMMIRVWMQDSWAGNLKLGSATQRLLAQIPTLLLWSCKALHKPKKGTEAAHRSEVTEGRKTSYLREGNFHLWLGMCSAGKATLSLSPGQPGY